MVLTDADIAARRIAWAPKPDGIAELAAELNLGLDAFVFVDDSDYELGADARRSCRRCARCRVPDEIEDAARPARRVGLFRAMRVTADDRERTATGAGRVGPPARRDVDVARASSSPRSDCGCT